MMKNDKTVNAKTFYLNDLSQFLVNSIKTRFEDFFHNGFNN